MGGGKVSQEEEAAMSNTLSPRPGSDRDAHDWQMVDEASVSQCGSSPRSVSREEYTSDLGELLDSHVTSKGNVSDEESSSVAGTQSSEQGDLSEAEALKQDFATSPDLPVSVHDGALVSGTESSLTPSCSFSEPASSTSSLLSEAGGSGLQKPDNASSAADSFVTSISSGSPSVCPSEHQDDDFLKTDDSSQNSTDHSGEVVHGLDTSESDSELVNVHQAEDLPSRPSTPSLAQHQVEEKIPEIQLPFTPAKQYRKSLPAANRFGSASMIERLWKAVKAYAQAIGLWIPAELQSRFATFTKQMQLQRKQTSDTTLLLASGLVSASALLIWSLFRNRSLSQQLLRSQMDMEHHVMTILNLNDKLSRGLQLPITHQCSYTSSMRSVRTATPLVSLSGSFF